MGRPAHRWLASSASDAARSSRMGKEHCRELCSTPAGQACKTSTENRVGSDDRKCKSNLRCKLASGVRQCKGAERRSGENAYTRHHT
eukprot:4228730-Amphidinium_carterae.1